MPQHFHVLLNPNAGAALAAGLTAESLRELFEREGHLADIDDDSAAPMNARLERIRQSSADVIVAAGGDGTVTAVAQAIVGTSKTLAIIPLGTVNALARDLAVPFDLGEWVRSLDRMEPRRIDVGEVNGAIFLHKVVVGFIPGIAAARERIRKETRLSAKLGFVRFFFRRLFRSRRLAIEFRNAEGVARLLRVVSLAVANNEYDEGLGRFFARSRFDRNTLGLYFLKHLSLIDLMRLTVEMAIGRWQHDPALEVDTSAAALLRTRKRLLKVMLDGEVMTLQTPLRFSVRPAALSILAPPAVPDDQTQPAGAEAF